MRTATPLTVDTIRKAKPSAKRQTLCDGNQLYLVIGAADASGRARKVWEYRYRSPLTRRRTSVTLGAYPAMGIPEARKALIEAQAIVQRGLDPALERKRARIVGAEGVLTLAATVEAWDTRRQRTVERHTQIMAMGRLRGYVLPVLGKRPLRDLEPADFRRVLDAIVKQGKHETAHRVCTVVHQVFEFAEARGDVERNPVRLLRKAYPHVPGRHFPGITDRAKFGALLRAIEAYGGRAGTRYALRLMPLVFVRSSELRGARWEEFDLDAALWTIPAERMKMSDNGAHDVPLSTQAVALLRELRELTGGHRLLFPGCRSPSKPLSDATMNKALTTMGFGPKVHRVHGFRTSASTLLNELAAAEGGRRFNFEHIEQQLAHRPRDAVRDAYSRATFLEQRRAMMQAWADLCDELKGDK